MVQTAKWPLARLIVFLVSYDQHIHDLLSAEGFLQERLSPPPLSHLL